MNEQAAGQITVSGHRFPIHLLDFYAQKGHRKVEGWLSPLAAQVIRHLSDVQDELGIKGSIGEIGVHHGKLFILLHLMLREGERSFVIDIFEPQSPDRNS